MTGVSRVTKAASKAANAQREYQALRERQARQIETADSFQNALDDLERQIEALMVDGGDARMLFRAICGRFASINPACGAIIASLSGEGAL